MRKIFAFVFLCLIFSASSRGEEVRVEHFELSVEGRVISASISITPLLPQEVVERIRGGLPAVFTYWFTLREHSSRWRDRKVMKTRVSVSVKYDPVRVEYQVTYRQKGELVDTRIFHHWQEAVNALTKLDRWEIFTVPSDALDEMLYIEAWVHLLPRTKWLFIPDDIKTDEVSSSHFVVYD
ncbi:MAG TPA: DUF4390 domain-containing protein [Thermoanaerobaculia bacterium]|nr:DUF4390 domain-containing protein [Thermoanaerobaculia bacterium]HUM30244.1 DUF4390 domain-containing protein [Thermoanaerobaculia bacterium]HXK68460.1 DUF4390 domain-containing protein [Thermoanaerobaculia bacterium]